MVEMAFKVNPGTTFYKNYFATKEEKAHFIEIAKQFFDKYFPDEKLSYVLMNPSALGKSRSSNISVRITPWSMVLTTKTRRISWQKTILVSF